MTIFHSLPTMALLAAALILTLCGGRVGRVLSFFGGLLCSMALVCALVAGAALEELLVCVLAAALASLGRKGGKSGEL